MPSHTSLSKIFQPMVKPIVKIGQSEFILLENDMAQVAICGINEIMKEGSEFCIINKMDISTFPLNIKRPEVYQ